MVRKCVRMLFSCSSITLCVHAFSFALLSKSRAFLLNSLSHTSPTGKVTSAIICQLEPNSGFEHVYYTYNGLFGLFFAIQTVRLMKSLEVKGFLFDLLLVPQATTAHKPHPAAEPPLGFPDTNVALKAAFLSNRKSATLERPLDHTSRQGCHSRQAGQQCGPTARQRVDAVPLLPTDVSNMYHGP